MKNIGVILSGGTGSRFNSDTPKQYHMLNGKEVISYSIDAFFNSTNTDKILVVADKFQSKRIEEKYGVKCVLAGNSRNQSLYNAICYIKDNIKSCKNILIHEAARPFITAEIIDNYFDCLEQYDAIITTQKVTDSLGKTGAHRVTRSDYYLIQAPEAFDFGLLSEHFSPNSQITATVQQLPKDIRVMHNYQFNLNYKITYPQDLLIAKSIIKSMGDKDGLK